MQRTSGDGFEPDGNGAGKDGFKDTGPNPTTVDAAWLNDMQENLAQYIESRGITLVPDDFTQLIDAVATHFPGSSTDNRVPRFSGTSGQIIDQSTMLIGDSGDVSGVAALAMTGALSGVTTIASTGDITAGDDIRATGDFEYVTPRTQTQYFSAACGMTPFAGVGDGVSVTDARASVTVAQGFVMWDLAKLLPEGGTVTLVRALVAPATVQAGTNRCSLLITTRLADFTTPTNNPVAASTIATAYDNGINTNYQLISSGAISTAVNKSGYITTLVYVTSDTGSTGGPTARINGIEVTWTEVGPK